MVIDWGIVVILGIGILVGALVFGGPEFRRRFFTGFRKFLGGIGSGQRQSSPRQKVEDEREVKRTYRRTINLKTCPTCGGTGRVPRKVPKLADPRLMSGTVECPTCGGTGEVEE